MQTTPQRCHPQAVSLTCIHSPRVRAPTEIGPAFAQHYYTTFDSNRAALQTLYKDASLLTFEQEQFMGMQSIMTKLTVRERAGRIKD